MSYRLLLTHRSLALFVPIALIAALLSFDALSGQTAENDAVDVTAEFLPVLPNASVTVMGDVFLASPAIAPLIPGPCVVSANGPIERSARTAPETVIGVQNNSCVGSSLASIGRDYVPDIDPSADLVVIGGIGLEFDWGTLAASCLADATRSAASCENDASAARANAANSFFSWRSLLQQTHRRAPDATIVVVAPPTPVSDEPMTLGGTCCGADVDGNREVRAVFDTAGSLRRAVIESVPTIPIVLVDADPAFENHRLDDADPWLSSTPSMMGSPTGRGADALAKLLGLLMPVGSLPAAAPATPSEILLVLGTTDGDAEGHDALQAAADSWFSRYIESSIAPSVAVVQVDTSDEIDDGPVGGDSPPVEIPGPVGGDSPPVEIPVDEIPVDGIPPFAPVADAAGALTQRALQDVDPIDPALPAPLYATTASELIVAIGELSTHSGVTSLIDLTAALANANSLFTPGVENQQIVVRASRLDLRHASAVDILTLRSAISDIDAEVTIIAPDSTQSRELSELLTNSGAVIARADASELGDALPVPTPPPILIELTAKDATAFMAQDVHVSAKLMVARPTTAAITWSANGSVIAEGQRTTLPSRALGIGSHEITVDASTDREQLTATFTVEVSADGDGVAGDSCEIDFDPFATDIDGDGLAQACDSDDDGDGLPDDIDPCPSAPTDNLRDLDLDRRPDHCDADNTDGPRADFDRDGFVDLIDNCPTINQNNQFDADQDGVGNVCEGSLRTQCTIIGSNGNDNIRGTHGNDIICGLGGDDVINGLGGNDLILAGPGNDVVYGGAGNDRIHGGNGADQLHGNGGDDVVLGEAGNDSLDGGFGHDVLAGGSGTDNADGGDGPDVLFGGLGNDTLRGGNGADTITGERGHDKIFGEDGADLLTGGPGIDAVRGGRGNDMIIDVESIDFVRGGTGDDLIDASPLRRT